MDWTQILLASAAVIATVISICQIIGKKFDKMEDEIKEVRKDIHKVDRRVMKIEDRLEFSNKVVYLQKESDFKDESKEN